jgi:hypothetical protein
MSYGVSAARAADASPDDPGRPQRSSTGAVFRSLFVPGWGQWYCDQKMKAAVFFITEGSFIASISWNSDQVKRYRTGGDDVLKKFHENQRNRMIWWLAGVTLLSMGDAYVDAHLYGIDISPELGPSGTPGLRFSKQF